MKGFHRNSDRGPPAASGRPRHRRATRSAVGIGVGLLSLLAIVARPAVADDPVFPKTRHRFPGWEFSLQMFEAWKIVPLATVGKLATPDPVERWLAGQFFERGADVDQAVRSGYYRRGVAEVYAIRAEAGTTKPAMDKLLCAAAARYGITVLNNQLDSLSGDVVKSKDGIKGNRYSLFDERAGRYTEFGLWGVDGLEVGVMVSIDQFKRRTHELGAGRVISSMLWTDEGANAAAKPLAALDGLKITPARRRAIELGLVKGWGVLVSPKKQYVVVYNSKGGKNVALATLIAGRIETIRAQLYEPQFPPSKPVESVSVVRVCGDAEEYRLYGGPRGSAGYWNYDAEELVFYDASPDRAVDDDTLGVLYHEAFHQYIHYAVGRISPHSWFDEGHGDFYAGAKFADGKFTIHPFSWRVRTVKDAVAFGVRSGNPVEEATFDKDGRPRRGYTPLEKLVRMTKRDYYSYPSVSYAQGWSLVYFLRHVVPQHAEYPAAWREILPTYFRVLQGENAKLGRPVTTPGGKEDGRPAPPPAEGGADAGAPAQTRDFGTPQAALDKATAAAFEGVDFQALETAWKTFVSTLEWKRRK